MKRPTTLCYLSTLFVLAVCPAGAVEKIQHKAWTDPETARREDPDFAIQGEYGSAEAGAAAGVQVVALGGGGFDAYLLQDGLPGLGWTPEKNRIVLKGTRTGDKVTFAGAETKATATIEGGRLSLTDEKGKQSNLPRIERASPTLGAKPPAGAVVLFDG